MKNVLVVGENSFIGASFANYATKRFNITTVDAKNNNWRDADFSGYDSVVHCAGIAHTTKNPKQLYYDVNCELAEQVAAKAKASGVKQFIFLSTMSVYGNTKGEITPRTVPNATDYYGGSKLAAEKKLQKLAAENFRLCILRPPMVYGFGCKGNFPRLVKLTRKLPVFPNIENQRSMIYIDNLCEFISQGIAANKNGVHFPQNAEYVNTTELAQIIKRVNGKKPRVTKIFNPLIFFAKKFISPAEKLFGNLFYEKTGDEAEYNVINFEEGVMLSCRRQ
jgi:UDP-glucose 4-epimerase